MSSKTKIDDLLPTLYSMAFLVEARDAYTGGHLWRVSQLVARLALAAGLSRKEAATAALGGFLHDLGKVGVPDAILNKTDKLTDTEYAIIKTHPDVGVRVLHGHPLAALVHDAVLSHHERVDGRGYPNGITEGAISQAAKMVSLADAFDAMTSSRPYRAGMPLEAALEQIKINLGGQFDKKLGERFIALGRAGELDVIVGHSDAGIPLHSCPMCGPVVVVKREQKVGDAVYCRVCGNEFHLAENNNHVLQLEPTHKKGTPADLIMDIDYPLLEQLIENTAPYLATGKSHWWNGRGE
ncbi:MAG: HD domain-containing protein [Methylococcales bacterium]|nr:HD domain-containing protein [Methylococcales bacterium]MDP3839738.1 HD domain-containing protein [Methylococcales bacterium]